MGIRNSPLAHASLGCFIASSEDAPPFAISKGGINRPRRYSPRSDSSPRKAEVHAGGSYNSTNDTRLDFGLGSEATINKIEVLWPSGLRQEFTQIQADAIYEIKEGEPIRKTAPLPAQ
jgi:ASPIC and UnbV